MPSREEKRAHVKLIARVMKEVLRDPDASIAEKLKAATILERHVIPGNNKKGSPKNLKNKKSNNKDILG